MYVSNYTVKIRLRHAGLKYGGVRNRLRLLPYIGKRKSGVRSPKTEVPLPECEAIEGRSISKCRSLSAKQLKGDLEFGTWNLELLYYPIPDSVTNQPRNVIHVELFHQVGAVGIHGAVTYK